MMARVLHWLGIEPSPTFMDSAPAPRDPEIEAAIKSAQSDLVQHAMMVDRHHVEVRRELAARVLETLQGRR